MLLEHVKATDWDALAKQIAEGPARDQFLWQVKRLERALQTPGGLAEVVKRLFAKSKWRRY